MLVPFKHCRKLLKLTLLDSLKTQTYVVCARCSSSSSSSGVVVVAVGSFLVAIVVVLLLRSLICTYFFFAMCSCVLSMHAVWPSCHATFNLHGVCEENKKHNNTLVVIICWVVVICCGTQHPFVHMLSNFLFRTFSSFFLFTSEFWRHNIWIKL